jgi:hypothetical protein
VKVLCVIAGNAAAAAGDAEPELVFAALAMRVAAPKTIVTRSTAIFGITLTLPLGDPASILFCGRITGKQEGSQESEIVVTHSGRNERAKTCDSQMEPRNAPGDAAIHATQINMRTNCQTTFNCV